MLGSIKALYSDSGKTLQRLEIIENAKKCLGFDDALVPEMLYKKVGVSDYDDFVVEHLTFDSWENVKGAANLYLPKGRQNQEPVPWVLLCCGHGGGCKLNPVYQAMAQHLACNNLAVLVPDNIGQGERLAMGHRDEPAPFVAGLSLQTLILLEDYAHIKAALHDSRFDNNRLAAIGNSGGGLATCFLSAFADELSLIVSSGYPSIFEFIARKEKKHCCCNILPGIIGKLEMWHLYSCFVPKPLFIFQGYGDHFFPQDLFQSTARRIAGVYDKKENIGNFSSEVVPGGHSWDENRIKITAEFICHHFKLKAPVSFPSMGTRLIEKRNILNWEKDYYNVAQTIKALTGVDCKLNSIYEIFPYLDGINDEIAHAFYTQVKLFTGKL